MKQKIGIHLTLERERERVARLEKRITELENIQTNLRDYFNGGMKTANVLTVPEVSWKYKDGVPLPIIEALYRAGVPFNLRRTEP